MMLRLWERVHLRRLDGGGSRGWRAAETKRTKARQARSVGVSSAQRRWHSQSFDLHEGRERIQVSIPVSKGQKRIRS